MTIGINQAIRFSELIALGNFRGRKVKIDEMFHIQKLKIANIIQYKRHLIALLSSILKVWVYIEIKIIKFILNVRIIIIKMEM